MLISGADPGFQVRGAHFKKLRRVEGGANIFGVFRVKNHDFTPKNHIFPILGGRAPGASPAGSAPVFDTKKNQRKHPVSKCLTFQSSHGHLFLLLKYNVVQLQFYLKGYLNATPLCDVLRSSHTETKKKGGIT